MKKRGHTSDALRGSDARYRRLFETAQDGILILDAQSGTITDVNPFLTTLLDYSRDDFLGKSLWDIGAFKQIQESKDAFRELQNKRYIRYDNLPLETRSGRRVNVEFVSNVYDENGKNVIQCNIRDITGRGQADEALRKSQQRLIGIVANAQDAIITVDEHQRIVLFNAAAETIFGCPQAEAMGQPIECFIPQRFRAADSVHLWKFGESVVTKRVIGVLESLWALRTNGEEFQIEASISSIEVAGKKLFTVILRDVTARKRVEETLREYERVVQGLDEMVLVVDKQYRYVIANLAFLNFRGIPEEKVVGHFVHEVVGEDVFATQIKEKMDECFLGNAVHYEMDYDFPGMGKREVAVSYFPILRPGGVERIACVLRDITERKQAEEALRKSEERFSKAFRSNPLAITISTEAEGCYLDVNDVFLDLLGRTRNDVIGRTAEELGFWVEPLDGREMIRQLREGDVVAKRQMRYRTAEGKIREAEVWAESIELEGQRCVLAISRDVTEMMQLEAQLRQAQKMEAVGRLAGGIAHDFNNILGVIMGYSDISLGLIASENPVYGYIAETKKAANRAASLTKQLLAFSRKQVVFPRIVDLNEVVQNATEMFLRLVGEDVTVEFRPHPSLGSIKADPGQIEQALMNLVVNARDAMPTGGRIIIETGEAELDEHYVSLHSGSHIGQYVVLVVSDTGCGMDGTVQSQIFEPFFTTKEVGYGTGLGLSTVYGIVKQSGGNIGVYSEPGKGTTFKIYFPRVGEGAEALVSSNDAAEPRGGSETILVVEDDKTLRELTVNLLRGGGYRVLESKGAEEALRTMANSQAGIDLLLTDVVMPKQSGPELVKLVEKRHPKARVVFMSGYSGDMVKRHGLSIKEDLFLEKPFTKRSLLVKVYSALHPESEKQPDI
jgi:two-component system, cell cycle sensor histidine kinase and response regulator CckA